MEHSHGYGLHLDATRNGGNVPQIIDRAIKFAALHADSSMSNYLFLLCGMIFQLCGTMWYYVLLFFNYVVLCGTMWCYVELCGAMWYYAVLCGTM